MRTSTIVKAAAVCVCLFLTTVLGEGDKTQAVITPQNTTTTTNATSTTTTSTTATSTTSLPPVTTTTTPVTKPPKVDVMKSALCTKCSCNKDDKQLDCSKRNLSAWFTDEEWKTLQNGDLVFETIILESNNLTEIPQLPAYPVKNLYLAFNRIAAIAVGAFGNLSELTKLDLSHNKLSSKVMVPDVFKGRYSPSDYLPLDKMRELNLCHNELHNLDPDLFEHLPKLESLILCKNVFQVIDHLSETAIASLTSLKTLDLSYMELKDLPEHLLHGPRALENLILSGNLLENIPKTLELAINLKRLVLDENLLTAFENKSAFPAIKSLRYLSISYMPELKMIGNGGLNNLQNLTELVASNNPKLSFIDVNAFARATRNPEIFDYPPLEKLHLHNNNLSILQRGLLQRWDKINTIDIRFNPWDCSCDNSWLIHTLMTQINRTTAILAKDVDCNTPAEWKNVSLLKLNADKKVLTCSRSSQPAHDSLILIGLLMGVLLGIPITLAGLFVYRRGCFGLLNRNSAGGVAVYNRASFSDDANF